ncbi:MAG: hypothetical protein QOE05_1092 [Actinomycetota bacterium]|nr:hypothetical protein [Actinomycetota bacterium]
MPTYVALLRGINLGSKRRVAMADLRSLLEGIGYDDVRTHLQSGNAVFRAGTRSAAAVRSAVHDGIADELGMAVDVVGRTAAQLAKVVEADPYAGTATDPARYLVTFLDKAPAKGWLADVDVADFEPEQVEVRGSEVYLWLPKGVHASRLARLIGDKKLGGTATSRNWNVVTKLAELAAAD